MVGSVRVRLKVHAAAWAVLWTGLGGRGHSQPYRGPIPGPVRENARRFRTLDHRACPRENHGDLNFAGRVANRVGERHCVGDSYTYWRRLTRRAERTYWPA